MKVTGFATRVVRVPREEGPLAEGPGVRAATFVTLRLYTDEGLEGISYAGFTSALMTPALKAAVDALAQQTVGSDPMEVEAINGRLTALGGTGAPPGLVTRAVSAIDVALWDLRGKALGQPVYKLLGGGRDKVPAYASGFLWRNYDLEALRETAARLLGEGWRAMKFRLGGEDTIAQEVARVEAVRDAVGPDVTLMVDINQGWDINRAMAVGRRLEEFGIYWLEDPIYHQDYAGYGRLAAALDVPIATGEYLYGVTPFRYLLEYGGADIVMVDLLRVGGITQWMKVAHLAEAYNLPVVSHLATEYLAHAVAAAPNGLIVEHMPWSFPLFREVPPMEGGQLVLPQKPGFGLEFDEEALDRYAVE